MAKLWRVTVVLGIGVFLGILSGPPVSAAPDARAVAFRTELGLRTDGPWLDWVSASPGSSDIEFGVLLTRAETRELQRRNGIGERVTELSKFIAAASDSYAGAFIDNAAKGVLVINTTLDTTAATGVLASMIPPDVPFEVRHVEYSWAELAAVDAALGRSADAWTDAGVSLSWWGISERDNRVAVAIDPSTSKAAEAVLIAKYEGMLQIERSGRLAPAVCSGRANCLPLRGGLHIWGTGGAECSSGFVARDSSNRKIVITAGHCGGIFQAWNHPTGNYFGTVINSAYEDYTRSDAMSIHNNSFTSDTPSIYWTDAYPALGVTSVQTTSGQMVGETVCKVGWRTGRTCGTLQLGNVNAIDDNNIHLTHMRVATAGANGGDSGGAVLTCSTLSGCKAKGIVEGNPVLANGDPDTSRVVYSHIDNVRIDLGLTIYLDTTP